MIKTEGLMKKFQSVLAVDRLDLDIPPGEIFGFLGPNGAGKTTTVKPMRVSCVQRRVGLGWGGSMSSPSHERPKKSWAWFPINPNVYPHLTGNEFLRFIGDLYEVDISTQKRKKSRSYWKCLSWGSGVRAGGNLFPWHAPETGFGGGLHQPKVSVFRRTHGGVRPQKCTSR